MIDEAQRAARRLARLTLDTATLLAKRRIVAFRYDGKLGVTPFSMLYVGQERHAREFEIYFKFEETPLARATRTDPPTVLFRGNLFQYALQRSALEGEASQVDLVVHEVFPGAAKHDEDLLHYPVFDGTLEVCATLEQQIRRMRSRGERRLMRDMAQRDEYSSRIVGGAAALETFRTSMYEPYVRERFGPWGFIDDAPRLRLRHERSGTVLLVAARDRPDEAVCGALLVDEGKGVLRYDRNGFLGAGSWSPRLMAERMAALELALLRHAIGRRVTRIDLGYARGVLNDGLLVHKHRLGCSFAPASDPPLFRLRVRPGRRAAVFARFPLIVGLRGTLTAMLGYDDAAPRLSKRRWRGIVKGFGVSLSGDPRSRGGGLQGAVVWTNAIGPCAKDPAGMGAFRQAVEETLDLPGGIEFRTD